MRTLLRAGRLVILSAVVFAQSAAGAFRQAEPPEPALTEEERSRIESEANAQAEEADKLFAKKMFAEAIPLYEAERESRSRIGDLRYEAYAIRAVGLCRAELGEFDAASMALREASRLDGKREDFGMQGSDLFLIAKAMLLAGKPEAAIEESGPALALLRKGGDKDHESEARIVLAKALSEVDRNAQAIPELLIAADLAEMIHDPLRRAEAWLELGDAQLILDAPGQALEYLLDARMTFAALNRTGEVARIDRLLGDALVALGRFEIADEPVRKALVAHERLGDLASQAEDLRFLALWEIERRNYAAGRSFSAARAELARKLQDADAALDALLIEADAAGLANDRKARSDLLEKALASAQGRQQPQPGKVAWILLQLAGATDRRDLARTRLEQALTHAKTAESQDLIDAIQTALKAQSDSEVQPPPAQKPEQKP